MAKADLKQAKVAKQDEFYTQLVDIEKELKYYKQHFQGKVVLCNCDDPYESNFFKYFALNFNALGLKKLIATCYNGSPVSGNELLLDFGDTVDDPKKIAYKVEITEVTDVNGDGAINLADVKYLMQNDRNVISILKGNGDFRSQECIELLKEADIVVTNPPFSLFREYIAQLVKYDKKFIIIGNQNAITYKECFQLIKENKMWLGASVHSGDREFKIPPTYEVRSKSLRVDENGNRYIRVVGIRWFTNLDYPQRHEELVLYKHYSPEEYPKYDNYDAININKSSDIPCDYDGYMGVPITFMDKYNPDQFEIIGQGQGNLYRELTPYGLKQDFVDNYYANGGKGSIKADHPVLGYYNNKGIATIPYMRIIIRRKK
ncbi:MAG: adenine-specific methyltransferase EcoRI family protein [Paludibacteraceae bacterium]|nr:adenine-specific methyltransferase EcoRI family protein [Paludibacteraceae bacterium]